MVSRVLGTQGVGYQGILIIYRRCVHVEPAQSTPSTAPPFPCETHPAQRLSISRCRRAKYVHVQYTKYYSSTTALDGRSTYRYVCVCFLPIHSGHQVRWTYQPGSHRRKVTQDFSSTFLRCVPQFFSREGFSHSFPSSTVKSNFVY